MRSRFVTIAGILGAVTTLFGAGKSNACDHEHSAPLADSKNHDLTEKLIEAGAITYAPNSDKVVIDQEALINQVRAEVARKLNSRISSGERVSLEQLLRDLSPGSFSSRTGGTLDSMEFNKATANEGNGSQGR